MRTVELLRQLPDDDGTRGVGEALELAQMFVERLARAGPLDGGPDEERPLGRGRDGDQIACDAGLYWREVPPIALKRPVELYGTVKLPMTVPTTTSPFTR
jgi:hypothetical protein